MIGKVITIKDHEISETASDNFMSSARKHGVINSIFLFRFDAVTPDLVPDLMREHNLKWTYPRTGSTYDMRSGLKLSAYQTNAPRKRVACFLSHFLLWKECLERDESMFIFEHDALFTGELPVELLEESRYDIIGLNDPRGATRRSDVFHKFVQDRGEGVIVCPKVDLDHVPQGIAGNSAYFIKPNGAKKLLSLVKEYGAWPNDAIMCRQLLAGKLGVLNPYCTKVQGTKSTTTL